MSQPSNPHPHWWREIKASGRINLGPCTVYTWHNDPVSQHYALWEVAAFKAASGMVRSLQVEGCPTCLHRLCPQDFLLSASEPQNFQVIRLEKTLALAMELQACAEASGAMTGILCRAIRELQRCMAPFMILSEDDVMKASLLRNWDPPPLQKRRPSSTVKEMGSQECQALLPNKQKSPGHRTCWADYHSCYFPVSCSHPSLKGRKSWEGIDIDPHKSGQWVHPYLERDNWLLEWWEEFHPPVHSMDGCCDDALVKNIACQ